MKKEDEILSIDLKNEPELVNYYLSKKMVAETSIHAAVVFCELKNRRDYIVCNKKVPYEFWFQFNQKEMQEKTDLTFYEQRKAICQLVAKNIVRVKKIGVPASNYFWINSTELLKKYL
jgi:hypothetical protein